MKGVLCCAEDALADEQPVAPGASVCNGLLDAIFCFPANRCQSLKAEAIIKFFP